MCIVPLPAARLPVALLIVNAALSSVGGFPAVPVTPVPAAAAAQSTTWIRRFGAVVTRKIAFDASATVSEPMANETAPPASVYAADPASKRITILSMFRNQPTPGAGISVIAPVNSASSCALVSVISLTCKPVMPVGPTAKLGPGVLPTNEFAVMGF